MSVEIVYCYPMVGQERFDQFAFRFANSYAKFPPQLDHETTIVACGGPPNDTCDLIKLAFPNCRVLEYDNQGFDIGSYQFAAARSSSDMILFLGASSYCRRPGWLLRMVDSFTRNGPWCLLGAMGNTGVMVVGVYPHLRTTAFWCKPDLMNRYPIKCTSPAMRYPIEHGPQCLTQWCRDQGMKVLSVDWEGENPPETFNASPNGFHRGNQSALLMGDRLTEPPYHPFP